MTREGATCMPSHCAGSRRPNCCCCMRICGLCGVTLSRRCYPRAGQRPRLRTLSCRKSDTTRCSWLPVFVPAVFAGEVLAPDTLVVRVLHLLSSGEVDVAHTRSCRSRTRARRARQVTGRHIEERIAIE